MGPVPNRGDLLCHCGDQALLNALKREPHAGGHLSGEPLARTTNIYPGFCSPSRERDSAPPATVSTLGGVALSECPKPFVWIDSRCSRIESGARRRARVMKDYLAQVEKLRKDAAECALIRDLATEKDKRELFDRLASHLTVLADQVEQAILQRKTGA